MRGVRNVRPMPHLLFNRATLSCDKFAACNCAVANIIDYNIFGSSLVLVGSLAKQKPTINQRV